MFIIEHHAKHRAGQHRGNDSFHFNVGFLVIFHILLRSTIHDGGFPADQEKEPFEATYLLVRASTMGPLRREARHPAINILPFALLLARSGPPWFFVEKLRMAKSAFEHASNDGADAAATAKKTAVGLVYLAEALLDMAAELQEVKTLLNKARKDMNEKSERTRA